MSVSVEELFALIEAGEPEKIREALDAPGTKKLLNRSSPNGEYPIHVAARTQQRKIVELLLLAGANPNQESEEKGSHLGYTTAHYAASNGDVETLQVLANYKADFNRPSADKWTPLHVATFKGCAAVMTFLVSMGADVNCANNYGQPPILFAVNHGRVADVRFLIKSKADLKYKDLNEDTLLHHAFHFQLSKTFEGQYIVPEAQLDVGVVLVLNGVSPDVKNLDGQSAYFYIQNQMPSLPEALNALFGHREKLVRASVDLNYLSLVSAKPEQFVALGLSEEEAAIFCQLMAAVDDQRIAARKGKSKGAARPADAQDKPTADSTGPALPPSHPPVSPEQLRSGEDPSGGKCPFFQKRGQQLSEATKAQEHAVDDKDKPLCPFSWAFVARHRTTILLCVTSFVFGMWANQTIDRVFPKP